MWCIAFTWRVGVASAFMPSMNPAMYSSRTSARGRSLARATSTPSAL